MTTHVIPLVCMRVTFPRIRFLGLTPSWKDMEWETFYSLHIDWHKVVHQRICHTRVWLLCCNVYDHGNRTHKSIIEWVQKCQLAAPVNAVTGSDQGMVKLTSKQEVFLEFPSFLYPFLSSWIYFTYPTVANACTSQWTQLPHQAMELLPARPDFTNSPRQHDLISVSPPSTSETIC
jgi:hypothetical protein